MALTPEQQALDYNPELQDVSRQRKLAELLMAQGMQQPQGQMISGHYVAPSWSQQLNPMANILAGQAVGERADIKQQELATALRGKQQEVINEFANATTPQEQLKAASSQYAPSWLQAAGADLLKTQKAEEGTTINRMNFKTGQYEPVLSGGAKLPPRMKEAVLTYGLSNNPKDWTPEQQKLVNNYIPPAERMGLQMRGDELADQGIGGYGGVGGASPRPAMPTIGQGSPILAKPGMPTAMPAAGVNPYEDFNKSIVPPANLPPRDQRKWVAESNTPLTGDASTRVQGGLDTIDAIDSYRKILKDYSKLSSLNPTQRANLEAAYFTMTLKSKEANKLGVLNGRDQEILEKLAPNPNDIKSLLVANDVLSEQALKQRDLIGKYTLNAYGEQQKKIPQYVINKVKPLQETATVTEAQANRIERPSMIDETTWGFMTSQEKALFSIPGKR